MAACSRCGTVPETTDARFCEACGAPLATGSAGSGAAVATRGGCRCAQPVVGEDGFCEVCGLRHSPDPRAAGETPAEFEHAVDAGLAIACDRGRKHESNQDHGAVVRRDDGCVLMVVCDGVSTATDAELAARRAVDAAVAAFLAGGGGVAALMARTCLRAASEAVAALNETGLPDEGPATTVVLAVVEGREAALTWVGDSRGYIVMPGLPEEALTRDDSWCQQVVAEGRMTYDQAVRSPEAHMITQWLGLPPDEIVAQASAAVIPPGASLLLCSDGLWNYLDTPGALGRTFTDLARRGGEALGTCRHLVAHANAAGGRDNITVALCRPS